jgi:hypothetical protein
MAKIRVLRDYVYEGWEALGEAIPPGTVIEDATLIRDPFFADRENPGEARAARYPHPVTGAEWISYDGAFEVI